MGVRSFCDLDDDLYPVGDFENLKKDETLLSVKDQLPLSNKYAFTRDVHHSDDDPYPKLLEALDSFVLSGAIKLFRQATGSTLVFRHHTMLIHESTRIDKHDELKSQVESLWNSGGYSGGIGVTRLRNLYHSDFELVTNARAGEEFQKVEFAKIKPYIGEVIARVEASGSPVITVSSDKSSEVPNFDTDSVWQILIGGMKLSRGYTVEGLTTSYFRRKPGATDTLMQAGRWFGYRPGYADLVRVYLGRSEPRSKKPTGKNPKVVAPRTVDLYECFEAACRDEELFRLELKRYSGQGLTPEQVPPLVYSSHAEMIPTARNKRWSSKLVFRNFGGEWIQKTLISDLSDTYGHNKDLVASLVEKRYSGSVGNETGDWENFDLKIGPKSNSFRSIWFEVSHQDMLDFLGSYKWATSKSGKDAASFNPMEVELEFLRGVKTDNEIFDTDPQIDSWIVLMPQVENDWTHVKIGNLTSSVIERVQITRDGPEAKFERPYKVLGEPRHRPVAEFIAGVRSKKIETGPPIEANTALELLGNGKRRGVMLLFFIGPRSDDENYDKTVPRSVGFELLPPDNSARKTLGYVAVSNPAPGSVINSNS
jgi:hypothetical protein